MVQGVCVIMSAFRVSEPVFVCVCIRTRVCVCVLGHVASQQACRPARSSWREPETHPQLALHFMPAPVRPSAPLPSADWAICHPDRDRTPRLCTCFLCRDAFPP